MRLSTRKLPRLGKPSLLQSEEFCHCHYTKESAIGLGFGSKHYVCTSRKAVRLNYHCLTCGICKSEEYCLCHYKRTRAMTLNVFGDPYVCRSCRKARLGYHCPNCGICGNKGLSVCHDEPVQRWTTMAPAAPPPPLPPPARPEPPPRGLVTMLESSDTAAMRARALPSSVAPVSSVMD